MSLSPPSLVTAAIAADLPIRQIPGSYGFPLLGPLSDRLDYFWFQKPESFFKNRMEKYKSTVFRTNVPPTFPFFVNVNPNVIAVLDVKSFSHLFDIDLVDKKDVLVGDFVPDVSFTGNMRVGVYQDPSDPQHSKVKGYIIDILKRSSGIWASELVSKLDVFWDNIESTVSKSSSASYLFPLQQFLFTFLCKVLAGADTSRDPKIAESGHAMINRWLALQLLPITSIGILQPLEEIFLHSFAYPSFLVSGDYNNIYNFIKQQGKDAINRGEIGFGLTQEEAIHNLLFVLGFNSFGGFTVFLPSLIDAVTKDSALQEKLKKEARENGGSTLTFDSVKEMPLVQSVVYETLRMNPPVPLQFGRARKDFRLTSHDSVYDVKKGELLCGYQKLVMRDSLIFDEPDLFKPDRFTKEKGAQLLDYLYWSNGPQSGSPTLSNKQCAGKDVVTLTAALIVAHLFRRYDSITVDGSSITALQKSK
ncbi:linolenate hydroperoxide lyase, chloroplastic [Vigna radiata var. radiata]|uniref:Linolenate hydroperoxide lyase, chloroplastic n=1 Tax=Vigna radiata var. radiata TaxID=3916 RepID=A0A1S3T9D6_VIGRR|nr:linolenate hydroperoxide lyase, chloroplastic [Vigna radiata var. radiata]